MKKRIAEIFEKFIKDVDNYHVDYNDEDLADSFERMAAFIREDITIADFLMTLRDLQSSDSPWGDIDKEYISEFATDCEQKGEGEGETLYIFADDSKIYQNNAWTEVSELTSKDFLAETE